MPPWLKTTIKSLLSIEKGKNSTANLKLKVIYFGEILKAKAKFSFRNL